jgi:hypothetical protein
MNDLKDRLIRLGSENPELQKHIRPVLDRIASDPKQEIQEAVEEFCDRQGCRVPRITRSGKNEYEFSLRAGQDARRLEGTLEQLSSVSYVDMEILGPDQVIFGVGV